MRVDDNIERSENSANLVDCDHMDDRVKRIMCKISNRSRLNCSNESDPTAKSICMGMPS
jgi:hypothetical protein